MRNALVFVTLLAAGSTAGCALIQGAIAGSCNGTQDVAGMSVPICTESNSQSISDEATLNSACRSGQLGAAANDWRAGQRCSSVGRLGGCSKSVQGIPVTIWFYAGSHMANAQAIEALCPMLQATYRAP